MQCAVEAAVRKTRGAGVLGKRLTPFLLDAANRATGGAALQANLPLLKNNARVAAEIAMAPR